MNRLHNNENKLRMIRLFNINLYKIGLFLEVQKTGYNLGSIFRPFLVPF
jgi:hypothetical protein